MAIVAADWSVTRSNGNIRYIGAAHTGAATYATVLQLHRWLQDLSDDAEYTGNDQADITSTNLSSRSTDNIITLLGSYNIDDTTAQYLYDGSIIQASGATIYDGIVNFGNAAVQIQLIQNGAVTATDFWNQAGVGLNADATQGISHRFLVKTRTGGADIDLRRIVGTCRRYGFTFSEFRINATSRGNNVLALTDASDLNNATASATVATWTTITNTTSGYKAIDVNNDGTNEFFYSEWNRATYTINQFYERMKYITRDGSVDTLYGLNGELFRGITHQITTDTPVGTFAAFEAVSWTGGTGQMLAINSPTAPAAMWIQLLTGSTPTDNQVITGGTSLATCLVNVTVTARTVSTPMCGLSTGSAIIGAYGFGIEYTDLAATDTVFSLANVAYNPPNNVTFSVAGLVATEDRVLVGPWNGSTYDAAGNPEITYAQFTLNGALIGAAVTAVVVSTAIPLDTPNTGTIRVLTASGLYKRCAYTSWTGSTFTITASDFSANNADNLANTFISYIDKLAAAATESFTSVYVSSRSLVVKCRDGGGTPIKEYISSSSLSSTGGSVTVIRAVDA